jgi:hypothetical protein
MSRQREYVHERVLVELLLTQKKNLKKHAENQEAEALV